LTCQSNRFRDNSTNAFALTVSGNPSIQTFSPFPTLTAYASGTNGGSGYFDGSGDSLSLPTTGVVDFGTGNFTVECWIYLASLPDIAPIIYTQGSTSSGMMSFHVSFAGALVCNFYNGSAYLGASISGVKTNCWHHVVGQRSGNVWSVYLDGVKGTDYTQSVTVLSGAPTIGINPIYAPERLHGYICNLRVTKGGALYSSNFTPPTTLATTTVSSGTVTLLCNFTNGGIIDNAMSNDLETVNGAAISTTQSKFGGASMYFDGSGDYLIQKDTPNLAFGTGDFTIEMWLYRNASGAQHDIIAFNPTSTNGAYPSLYISSGNTLNFYTQSADRITGGTISTGQWYHIALARSGTSTKLFIDGTQSGSTYTDTNSYLCGTNRPVIGSGGFTVSGTLNAYIDDLRITKGYARYTANFTAPAAPFVGFGD
jgi:hypothetical protein